MRRFNICAIRSTVFLTWVVLIDEQALYVTEIQGKKNQYQTRFAKKIFKQYYEDTPIYLYLNSTVSRVDTIDHLLGYTRYWTQCYESRRALSSQMSLAPQLKGPDHIGLVGGGCQIEMHPFEDRRRRRTTARTTILRSKVLFTAESERQLSVQPQCSSLHMVSWRGDEIDARLRSY